MDFTVTPEVAAKVGNSVVRSGWLSALRSYLGLSGNAMAAALGTYPATYRTWESPDRELRQASAITIGFFYFEALSQLAFLSRLGLRPEDLVSLSQVAIRSGMAVAVIQDRCALAPDDCVDLGTLGMFMRKTSATRGRNVRGPV